MAPRTLKELLLILGLSVPLLFWGMGSIALLDPNEGMYGSIALEMADKGDWVTPRFNGVPYFHRPPLYFWLTALTIKAFGPSEWVIRLWTVLPVLGTALLLGRIGNLLYGRPAGVLSVLIMLTSVGVFRYARVAAADFLLVFSLTLAMYGLAKTLAKGEGQRAKGQGREGRTIHYPLFTIHAWPGAILFWLGCALGVLSKGLIGIILPVLIVGIWVIINGRSEGRGAIDYLRLTIYWPVGPLLFVALTLPWYLAAAWQNPGFFDFHIVDNQLLRFFDQWGNIEDEVPATTGLFLILVFVWFFPWSIFLLPALRYGFSGGGFSSDLSRHLPLVVGSWAATAIGFFSLSTLKLEHYVMPTIPSLSLMTGGLWGAMLRSKASNAGLKWCLGVGSAVLALVGGAMVSYGDRLTPGNVLAGLAQLNVYYRILQSQGAEFPYASAAPFIQIFKFLGWTLMVGLPLSFLLTSFRAKAGFSAILCLSGVIAGLVFKLLIVTEPYHSTKSLAAVLRARVGSADTIVHEGPLEYSGGLPFYTGKQIYILNGKRGSLYFGSRYAEAQDFFLDDAKFLYLWNGAGSVFLVTGAPVRESVLKRLPGGGRPFFQGAYGLRRLYANH